MGIVGNEVDMCFKWKLYTECSHQTETGTIRILLSPAQASYQEGCVPKHANVWICWHARVALSRLCTNVHSCFALQGGVKCNRKAWALAP
jgi:hypothetical protein